MKLFAFAILMSFSHTSLANTFCERQQSDCNELAKKLVSVMEAEADYDIYSDAFIKAQNGLSACYTILNENCGSIKNSDEN